MDPHWPATPSAPRHPNLVAPNDAIVSIRGRWFPSHDNGAVPWLNLAHGDMLGRRAWHCRDSNAETLGPPLPPSSHPPPQCTFLRDPEVPAVAVQAPGPFGIGPDLELILVAPLERRDDSAELPAHILLGPGGADREQAAVQHRVTLWRWPWRHHLEGMKKAVGTQPGHGKRAPSQPGLFGCPGSTRTRQRSQAAAVVGSAVPLSSCSRMASRSCSVTSRRPAGKRSAGKGECNGGACTPDSHAWGPRCLLGWTHLNGPLGWTALGWPPWMDPIVDSYCSILLRWTLWMDPSWLDPTLMGIRPPALDRSPWRNLLGWILLIRTQWTLLDRFAFDKPPWMDTP